VFVVLRPGKWDIPAYFGDGSRLNMSFAYLMLGQPWGVPFTLDQAYPFVRHATVAFGFPDILFDPEDAFVRLLACQAEHKADIALGLCPARNSFSKEDRVEMDDKSRVINIELRPAQSGLRYSWVIAIWKPSFTHFLHEYLQGHNEVHAADFELSAGHAIRAALEAGLNVNGLILNEKPFLDIGTPEGLREATMRGV
jgi:glucose-1-phosphate thymidylyltransferase